VQTVPDEQAEQVVGQDEQVFCEFKKKPNLQTLHVKVLSHVEQPDEHVPHLFVEYK
jgi:hypothetical protein